MGSCCKIKNLLGGTLVIVCIMSSCIPPGCMIKKAEFKNCTNDTIFIGVSHYDNIDSVYDIVFPKYVSNDTTYISQWNGMNIHTFDFIYPDSMCVTGENYLFANSDTCYFFLIKRGDAKSVSYSWDKICSLHLFRKRIVVRNKEGEYDTNIR
jgi:hypothetical protein